MHRIGGTDPKFATVSFAFQLYEGGEHFTRVVFPLTDAEGSLFFACAVHGDLGWRGQRICNQVPPGHREGGRQNVRLLFRRILAQELPVCEKLHVVKFQGSLADVFLEMVRSQLTLDLDIWEFHIAVFARSNEVELGSVRLVHKECVQCIWMVSPFHVEACSRHLLVDEKSLDVHDHRAFQQKMWTRRLGVAQGGNSGNCNHRILYFAEHIYKIANKLDWALRLDAALICKRKTPTCPNG